MRSWRGIAFSAAIVLPLALSACKKPDCDKAVDHTFSILNRESAMETAALLPAERQHVETRIADHKKTALADCKAGKPDKLTQTKYDCIMASNTKADLEKCGN
jgi:hypothetical protein